MLLIETTASGASWREWTNDESVVAFGRLGNRARYFVEALLIFSGGTPFGERNFPIDMHRCVHLDATIPADD